MDLIKLTKTSLFLLAWLVVLLASPLVAHSASYDCPVTKKFDFDRSYTQAQLDSLKFSVRIHDSEKPKVDRCSVKPSEGKLSCDTYEIDRVEVDKHVGYKKFYLFKSQFDVQLFPDMKFIENNGRGGIALGLCKPL